MREREAGKDDGFVGPTDRNAVVRPHRRPPDWKAVEEWFGLLARAVQQLHTYPLTSPICAAAIESCHRALAALDSRDRLAFRVTPTEVVIDHIPMGAGTLVGQEIARRLHRASVASVTIDRGASVREIGRFGEDLLRASERHTESVTLLEMLTEHGIDGIEVEMGSRPEVLEVGVMPPGAADDLARERARFEAQLNRGGVVNHLYPPQKGWVRLDPASALSTVSLLDLAVLAEDPARLALMLVRLTDDEGDITPAVALERNYPDVAMLISALDPGVARRMFARLARAVLDLEPENRQTLLRRSVLPGLLDGRVSGAILRDFPDLDLAEALCLLMDLETAAPELLSAALSRLELPAERHAAVLPLLQARLQDRETAALDRGRQSTLTRHALELVRVNGSPGKSFAEFAAFDLSVDEEAASHLGQIRVVIPASDVIVDQLTCLWHLICLEPNPDAVSGFLDQSFALLAELDRAARGGELPSWLARYRSLAERVRDMRPDVCGVIAARLSAFCTPERAAWLVDLAAGEPEERQAAAAVVDALGVSVAAPLVDLLEREQLEPARNGQTRLRVVTQLMADHVRLLATGLVPLLDQRSPAVLRALLRVLGSAGPGYEDAIAPHVSAADEQTAREALRALARQGTSKAARLVVAEIERQRGAMSVAAEETLWHFPAVEARRHTRELLGRRDFTTTHPHAAERLLDRVARTGADDLQPVLVGLAPMRFRIWNPALARVARKANAMLKSPPIQP